MSIPLSETHDLHTGDVPWSDETWPQFAADQFDHLSVDVAIVGGGIVGAIIGERLASRGMSLAVLDRRIPGSGSTAASTAQVMWAMDVPLTQLAARIGEDEAARRWRRVYKAVRSFGDRIDRLGLHAARAARPTVYLAGNVLGQDALAEEVQMRQRCELPSQFLTASAVASRFGFAARAASVSRGGFEIEPVQLTHALLTRARAKGAKLCSPVDIIALHQLADGVELKAADGRRCRARMVVLATGYERPSLFLPPAFRLHATFAIATPPSTAPLWRERAMVWEAADPYLYVRSDGDGRIIAGGEDIDQAEGIQRDHLIPAKTAVIAAKLEGLLGGRRIAVERRWAATFGSSPDGLPAIGRSAIMPDVWLAAAFGGNGIAFAALAADILERELAGDHDPDLECFDPRRFD
ncbi:MAG: FAD-dependent oxidoreductase [Sphingomonadaceae bacterium]